MLKEDSIKLGLLAPQSGVASLNCEEIIQAAKLACYEINQSNLLSGSHLELHIENDGSMPQFAVPAAQKLVNLGCCALLGNVLSNSRLAVVHQVAEPLKIPYLNYSAYEGGIVSPYFFNYSALPNQQIQQAIPYIANTYGYKGYFAGSNFEWPKGSIHAAKETLKALGGEIVGEDYFDFDVSSFTTLIESIETSGANFFVPYFAAEDQIKLLEQLSYSNIFNKVAILSGNFNEVLAASLSPNIRDKIYSVNSYFMNLSCSENESFLQRMQQHYPTRSLWPDGELFVTSFSASIYAAIYAFARAYGGDNNSDLLCKRLKRATAYSPSSIMQLDAVSQHASLSCYLTRCDPVGNFNLIESYLNIPAHISSRYANEETKQADNFKAPIELTSYQLKQSLEQLEAGIFLCDQQGYIIWVNKQLTQLFGYQENELLGQPFYRMLISPRFWFSHQQYFSSYLADLADTEPRKLNSPNIVGYRKDGTEFPASIFIGKSTCEDATTVTVSVLDITQEKAKQELMLWAATHDNLTKLPNRQLLRNRLDKALQRNKQNNSKMALIFIDLDNFKLVNDSYGHELGDKLLTIIADILLNAIRPGDTVARFGGDEFVILCEKISSNDELTEIAKVILDALHQPMTLQNIEYIATASIGIAINENEHTCADELLRNADVAMYQAKEKGRDQWIFFQNSMYSDTKQKLYIAMGLHDALHNDEFHLLIQPSYQLSPLKLKGGEALIRWVHKGQVISPVDFIPLAETNGFIYDIGLWVFQRCCEAQVRWHHAFNDLSLEYISVNLSPRQLSDPRLLDDFDLAIKNSGAKAEWFVLEITETAIMDDADQDLEILHQLKQRGFNIAIDDFGTGYSSFSQLVNLPLDIIKIDRCFITPLEQSESSRTLAKMIIDLAHNLGTQVIAEGVEDEFHQTFLIEHKCEAAQGYKYSKPIRLTEFELLFD